MTALNATHDLATGCCDGEIAARDGLGIHRSRLRQILYVGGRLTAVEHHPIGEGRVRYFRRRIACGASNVALVSDRSILRV
jgi:hypothetical protein